MRPLVFDVVRIGATALLGLFAGGLVFTVLAPSLRSLPGAAYVRYWQALNADYGRAMPVLLLTCLALLLVTCVMSYSRGGPLLWLSVLASALVVATIVLTLAKLDPLNRLADSWNPDQLPDGWADARTQWWNLHLARTAMATAAFLVLLAVQILTAARPGR
ncbi:hypothetical protein Aph01nite_47350 [Acrocarpospora phusangensis]|uniref:DUF1772 domain-containing protein n=1 Tax=Acrocarpospora phusangensis TaxID=1070424 RepID=A0A919QH86_9ACTN|nr:DUF1772 domain-containing protein [Acrocarpospora phusangensis]GIH26425.1 hypothetical protein Aph01nite_47350 [Acrocarpospora phusangensis]